MEIFRVEGGNRLDGSINVHGAKNSVLPILAASILAKGESVIHNCPDLSDVQASVKILRHLGCAVRREGDTVIVDSSVISECDIPHELMREMRSSVIFLGAVLARCGRAVLSLPGGCELGPRPIDLHIKAMRALGASVTDIAGNITCVSSDLHGANINLSLPSVGATENAMLAASGAGGVTVITNAAREPEIEDLQNYLNSIGGKVSGAGTSTVVVEGKIEGGNTEYTVIPDRIAAATYLSAAVSAGGRVSLNNVCPGHMKEILNALSQTGAKINVKDSAIDITAASKPRAVRPVITRPYPGFATDAQPPIMAAVLKAEGTTVFVENIFENRFRHAHEFNRMGADIKIVGKVAVVTGVDRLYGVRAKAADLRGAAALVVAALGAEGVTDISDIYHIDRGYAGITECFEALGGKVVRMNI